MDVDAETEVPAILNRQDRPILQPVEFGDEIAFTGYEFRLRPTVEHRRLDSGDEPNLGSQVV